MALKGFSATYTSVDPFEDDDEEDTTRNSEMVTPFPGYLKSMYVSRIDNDEGDEYDDDDNYNKVNSVKDDQQLLSRNLTNIS